MIRDVPYAVVTLLLYESLQTWFRGTSQKDFVLGGVAGGVGSFVTSPADVIKTKIQTVDDAGSMWAVTRDVWTTSGVAGFFRGSVPRLVHKVPANAFFFFFYEFFKQVLRVEEGGETGIRKVDGKDE